ncbi:MAG: argininosuccinate lyase [Planctomycetes bacterium]|nr:argininosuccinate lyase [Planctomycetota bacterium]
MAQAQRLWDKGEALNPEVLAYTVGDDYLLDRLLVEEDCWGSLAHSQMLAEQGIIEPEDREAIASGLRAILAEHRENELQIAPEEEDVHTAVEGRLVARIGDPGRRLHTARSRNDQVLVDVRLFAKRHLLDAADAVCALCDALLGLAEQEEETLFPGYTHLRQAMPSTIGLWASGHAEGLEESLESLLDAYRAVDRCPLGSAAGFGVPLKLDRRRTAELLGFSRLQVNVQAVQSSRGRAEAQALFAATLVGRDLACLAWDLHLYSSPEFGFLRLPGNVATGSSIMPQKKNPDVLELTRANSAVLQTHLDRVLLVSSRLPSSYHRDFQLTKEPLLKGLPLVRSMTRAMELTVRGLAIDSACATKVAPEAFATHRALDLVREGVPFRDAYRRVAEELAVGNLPTDRPLSELYAVEGSAGDLRLADARARVEALAKRATEAREHFQARLTALEESS